MGKKLFWGCVLVLLMAAAAGPLVCSAEGDPLASPTPRPTMRVAAPEISGVNLEIVKPEGDEGEITPSGGFAGQFPLGGTTPGLPSYLELAPQAARKLPDRIDLLSTDPASLAADLGQIGQAQFPVHLVGAQALPWMGLLGAAVALALSFHRAGQADSMTQVMAGTRRKEKEGRQNPLKEVCPGDRNDWAQVGFRGVKVRVPVYETRRVQVGYKKEVRQIPVYKNVKVLCGSRLVKKQVPVTRYRTQRVWAWKKVLQRVPLIRRIGSKRITVGYQEQRRWKRVQVEKRVPYRSLKTILVKEPLYETRKVPSGTRSVTRWVPRYREKQILVGYRTLKQTIPIYERSGPEQVQTIPNGPDPEEGEVDPGLSEKEQRLKETLLQDPAPEKEIAVLLGKGIGPDWPPEEKQKLSESWLYRTILFTQSCKEWIGRITRLVGAPPNPDQTPHLFSYSAYREAPLTLLSGEGIRPASFLPPHYLKLIYTQQKLEIGPRVEVTLYPEGLMNLNLTRRSWSLKIKDTTFFITAAGEVGFGKKVENQDAVYDQTNAKYSLYFGDGGISVKSKLEGVILYEERISADLEVKEIRTLQGRVTTLHTLGILVGLLGLIVIAALLYLYFNAGLPLPVPGEVPL